MALIDTTYFYGGLEIPQVNTPTVKALVEKYIDEAENSLLSALLGSPLYLELAATPTEEPYASLLNGNLPYVNIAGENVVYPGLIFVKGSMKKSPIANLAWYNYTMDNHVTQSTGTGEKVADAKNAKPASPKRKLIAAWNEMVSMNNAIASFLIAHPNEYPEFPLVLKSIDFKAYLSPINPFFG